MKSEFIRHLRFSALFSWFFDYFFFVSFNSLMMHTHNTLIPPSPDSHHLFLQHKFFGLFGFLRLRLIRFLKTHRHRTNERTGWANDTVVGTILILIWWQKQLRRNRWTWKYATHTRCHWKRNWWNMLDIEYSRILITSTAFVDVDGLFFSPFSHKSSECIQLSLSHSFSVCANVFFSTSPHIRIHVSNLPSTPVCAMHPSCVCCLFVLPSNAQPQSSLLYYPFKFPEYELCATVKVLSSYSKWFSVEWAQYRQEPWHEFCWKKV